MKDFHHNIFYYYRGASPGNQKLNDPQLENNTTKALINTLKHCSPGIAGEFLRWLDITGARRIEFSLQGATIGEERIHSVPVGRRLLLGIVDLPEQAGGAICAMLDGAVTQGSNPDAWVYGDDFVVLIESKVGDSTLEPGQMRGHFAKLKQGCKGQPKCLVRTWAEVHRFFGNLKGGLTERDQWLVGQFRQYLEWNGMTEFCGFQEWMFEFFVAENQDPTDKTLIRRSMEGFGDKVLSGVQRRLGKSFYQARHVGNFNAGDDHFWVAIVPAGGSKVFTSVAHQTAAISSDGLAVFVNLDTQKPIKRLRKRLEDKDSEQEFKQIVSSLPGPFSFGIWEVKVTAPMKGKNYPITTLAGGDYQPPHSGVYGLKNAESIGFDHLNKCLNQVPLAYCRLERRMDRQRVLELSASGGRRLVDEVVGMMAAFHPLVAFING